MNEINLFAEFPKNLEKYRGKHVAIIGNEVVAAGDIASLVWKEAKKKFPNKNPVLTFIPRKETLVL